MSAVTRESLLAQLGVEREQRQSDRLAELLGKVRCGRIDHHEAHQWIRPALFGAPGPRAYWCAGPGAIEGGSR